MKSGLLALALLAAAASAAAGGQAGAVENGPRVLAFTRAVEYVHESAADGSEMLVRLGQEEDWTVEVTDDPSAFSDERLAATDVVVFVSTSGDVLGAEQESALESFVRSGGGWVGIHGASNTEFDWPFFGELIGGGAWFVHHPMIQTAEVTVERPDHPAAGDFPERFLWKDEWYVFSANPRDEVTVLMSVDESTYEPKDRGMGVDHPVAWCHEVGKGRSFYTSLGHLPEAYSDPRFVGHVRAAVEWAVGRDQRVEIR